MAASASIAVHFTVLNALEQSVRISQFFCLVMYPYVYRYLFHPPSYSDSKLSRFAVDLQPWSPLQHGPGRNKAPPRRPHAHGAAFFNHGSGIGLPEALPEFRREGVWTIDNSYPEGFNASSKIFAPETSLDY